MRILLAVLTSGSTEHAGRSGRPCRVRFLIRGAAALAIVGALTAPARALTLPVSEDAGSKTGAVTAALGKATTLAVANGRHAFIRFDVARLAGIAPPAEVKSARLVIFLTRVKAAGELEVHAVSSDWTETPAGTVPAPGFGAAPLATIPAAAVAAKQFILVDVNSAVQAWLAGTSPDFGFAITSKDGIADANLGAKEGFAAGYPPMLEVEVDRGGVSDVWSLNGTNTYYDAGNVGIGTATPANALTVLTEGHGIEHTNGPVRLGTYVDSSGGWLGTISNHILHFFVNDGVSSMTIDTNGNVGMGTTSLTNKLAVEGDVRVNGRLNVNTEGTSITAMTVQARPEHDFMLRAKDASGFDALTLSTSASGNFLRVYGDAAKSDGGTSWGTISDQRLKQDVRPFESGLSEVLRLRPVRFHYRDGIKPGLSSAQEQVGFIAQEVREVLPEAVSVGEDGYLMLKADPIHWAAINAIRELNTKLEQQAEAPTLYSGNVTTDANGDATVTLPEGFETLDHDFRYQLTIIGQFAQAIVSSEIEDHRFGIKTDKPSVRVSWQVTTGSAR